MAEKAVAVVMTCVENPRNDVDGVDSCTFTVHAVTEPSRHLPGMYIAKIVEPAFIDMSTFTPSPELDYSYPLPVPLLASDVPLPRRIRSFWTRLYGRC
jgi:hypothetical protein